MLKKILIAVALLLVFLVVAIAAATFLSPTDFRIEREVVINRPKAEVFAYAKMLRNQNEWGPWFKKDPAMQQEFRGEDGKPGFVSYWKSENSDVGEGEQEIKNVIEGERMDSQLRFKQPFESNADAYILTDSIGDSQTKVTWGFSTVMPRPFNLMTLVMDMDAAVGNDFQQGLDTMKGILEK
jgi:hypothetical protein